MGRLEDLVAALDKAAASDFSKPVNVPSWDGFDGLARAVRATLDRFRERQAELLDKIEQLQTRYDRLEANIPGMVFIYRRSPDGRFSFPYVNGASKALFGLEPQELMADGNLLPQLLHPDDVSRLEQSVIRSAETLEPFREELRHIVRGVVRWYDFMSRPVREPNGDVVWDGIALEITDRNRATQTLQLSEAAFRDLHGASSEAFVRTELDGRILEASKAFLDIAGYSEEELSALSFRDLTPEKWHDTDQRVLEDQVLVRGYCDAYEKEYRRKDGALVPVEQRLFLDGPECRSVWGIVRDISVRRQAEERLKLTQYCVDNVYIGIFRIDDEGRIRSVNSQACKSLGYTAEELCSMSVLDIDSRFTHEEWLAHRRELRKRGSTTFETMHRHKNGETFPVEVTVNLLSFEGEEFCLSFVRDISEEKKAAQEKERLHAQLLQAQRLESVGRLAGGVAHDFNNMLSVILGYAELLQTQVPVDSPMHSDLLAIEKAAEHARRITRQLLAFSRKELIVPRTIQLNDTIVQTKNNLIRLIGEDVRLQFHPTENLWPIQFDPSQIEQICINLAVNARDAMPDGGTLVIETSNVEIGDSYCAEHYDVLPDRYVLLSFTDDGEGMDKSILPHIFEPFFTTKEVGKGTGLGLSTVYGIVKQNRGFINVYSEVGRGTTFRIYFPAETDELPDIVPELSPAAPPASGTILLVEDDDMVRAMITAMLQSIGYEVLVAANPHAAIELFQEQKDAV